MLVNNNNNRHNERTPRDQNLYGFKWANNSCGFDAIFCVLWVLYYYDYLVDESLLMSKYFAYVKSKGGNQMIHLGKIKINLLSEYILDAQRGNPVEIDTIVQNISTVDDLVSNISPFCITRIQCHHCQEQVLCDNSVYIDGIITEGKVREYFQRRFFTRRRACPRCLHHNNNVVYNPSNLVVYVHFNYLVSNSDLICKQIQIDGVEYVLFAYNKSFSNHFTTYMVIDCNDINSGTVYYDGCSNNGRIITTPKDLKNISSIQSVFYIKKPIALRIQSKA